MNEELENMVRTYSLEIFVAEDGSDLLRIPPYKAKNLTDEDKKILSENKFELVAYIKEKKKEESARMEATVKVILTEAWEPRTVYVDTRDIENEIKRIIKRYPEFTEEHIRREISDVIEKKEQEQKTITARTERIAKLKKQAAETGEPVLLDKRMGECDGSQGAECSYDLIQRFVQPDGTIKVERTHTF